MGQNIIELNGKRYDALSGAYLGKSSFVPKHITERFVHGKVIDGFVRPGIAHQATAKTEPKPKAQPTVAKHDSPTKAESKIPAKARHSVAQHVKAHLPERSKTLMRHVTKKPEFSLKPAIKPQAPAEMMARPKSTLMHKPSAYGVDPLRKQRAALSARHQAVLHFNPHHKTSMLHAVSPQIPVIAVQPEPASGGRVLHAEETPNGNPVHKRHGHPFDAAINRATSHEQPMHKHRISSKRRLTNSLAIIGVFLVIGGFVGFLNLPQLELKMASIHAGFGASMPDYTPTGYALENGVQRTGGTISLNFRSGSSRYTITQQSSNWNSQTLLDNTLALNGSHQTVQKNGQTIYIYGKTNNAAWVDGGVRYDITGNAQLSKDDIASIATSM